jgi:hypothetical protein
MKMANWEKQCNLVSVMGSGGYVGQRLVILVIQYSNYTPSQSPLCIHFYSIGLLNSQLNQRK